MYLLWLSQLVFYSPPPMPSAQLFLFYSLIFCHFVPNVWLNMLSVIWCSQGRSGCVKDYVFACQSQVEHWQAFRAWNNALLIQGLMLWIQTAGCTYASWRDVAQPLRSRDVSCSLRWTTVPSVLLLKAGCTFFIPNRFVSFVNVSIIFLSLDAGV